MRGELTFAAYSSVLWDCKIWPDCLIKKGVTVISGHRLPHVGETQDSEC
ncbi:MAG: hypothetical protein IJP95_09635 [Bacteroidales bacterium]|nr:hypothetical protein [Bacteroidales bacterium]